MSDFEKMPSFQGELKSEGLEPSKFENSFQRTEEWYAARSGNFTGSMIKDLMSSGRSSSKMGWGEANKIYDFSVKAAGTIFKIGKERQTGFRSMEVTTKSMSHGIMSEPMLIEKLIDDGIADDWDPVEFMLHSEIKHFGASLDGIPTVDGEQIAGEVKCPSSWDGFYQRMYKPVDEKHGDFWQVQAEMMIVGADRCLYAVAYPMTTDKYEVITVKASPIHQRAIEIRVKIANEAIRKWNGPYSYDSALAEAIAEFKASEL